MDADRRCRGAGLDAIPDDPIIGNGDVAYGGRRSSNARGAVLSWTERRRLRTSPSLGKSRHAGPGALALTSQSRAHPKTGTPICGCGTGAEPTLTVPSPVNKRGRDTPTYPVAQSQRAPYLHAGDAMNKGADALISDTYRDAL